MLDDSNLGGTLPRYSAKRNLHRALFFCDAPEARQVSLVGDFNSWNPTATPMARQPDGRWTLDSNATGKTRNSLNQPVSLLAVS